MSDKLIRNVIDSICFQCAKRMLHFQLFTKTSADSKYDWIVELLSEKRQNEMVNENYEYLGCSVCFGMLEQFSREAFLKRVNLVDFAKGNRTEKNGEFTEKSRNKQKSTETQKKTLKIFFRFFWNFKNFLNHFIQVIYLVDY
jgi:hypothetical protein